MNAAQSDRLRCADYVEHMLDAVQLARSYTEALTKADFLKDKKTQQAVILNLLVIGEAATKIAGAYPEIVAQHPEVRWRDMRGMRNRMAHGYFDTNLEIVWDTVQLSLPELERQLLELQRQIGDKA